GRKHAAIGKELADTDRHVGSREKRRQRLDWNAIDSRLSRRSHFGIRVVEQEDENGQLFGRSRRQDSGSGEQTNVAGHLASSEEIEQRGRRAHRLARKSW